jgi:hypothetical protein
MKGAERAEARTPMSKLEAKQACIAQFVWLFVNLQQRCRRLSRELAKGQSPGTALMHTIAQACTVNCCFKRYPLAFLFKACFNPNGNTVYTRIADCKALLPSQRIQFATLPPASKAAFSRLVSSASDPKLEGLNFLTSRQARLVSSRILSF